MNTVACSQQIFARVYVNKNYSKPETETKL